ncbi:hypothetical protein MPSEU_000472900 [Mayamaea pseudoterrestris]|nr:hypothetical protein MPSEU_000472900 [Mayamaea pseudoterrestris]
MQESSTDEPFGIPANATTEPESIHAHLEEGGAAAATSRRFPLIRATTSEEPSRSYFLVGRQAASVDIHIGHPSISRQHAAIYFLTTGSCLFIVDFGGKYGTNVNGTKIPSKLPHELKHGDIIVFGNVRERQFTVTIVDDATTVAANGSSTAEPGQGLEGRAKREAEIAAMIGTLDQDPVYQPQHVPEPSKAVPQSLNDHDEAPCAKASLAAIAERYQIPFHQVEIESESSRRSLVTCISIDPAGSRFVVGTTDAHLRFYDFGGMTRNRAQSFQTIVPQEGQPLVGCAYSNSGDRILVGTTGVQPIVLDRDGTQVVKFMRGDMYVTDQSKTVGHTFGVTAVDWHPLEKDLVLTSSQDGSVRMWNILGKTQFDMLVCDKVFQAKDARGLRIAVTCVCFHPSGREFAMGTACGSIQIWSHARVSNRPERVTFDAHGAKKAVTSLVYNTDGALIGSRSIEDDSAKIWDNRRLSRSSKPEIICKGLESFHEPANLAFSPDGKIVCAGAAKVVSKGNELGRLNFYDISKEAKGSVQPVFSINLDQGISPVVVKWHTKIKQIFVGCSDGRVIIFYDPVRSKNGALLISAKMGSQSDSLSSILQMRAETSGGISGQVVTPFSLPMYREDHTSEKKRKRQERKDPVKSKEPERPASGKHKAGGQEGSNVTFQQFVADGRVAKSKEIAGTDPRKALLRFESDANESGED